MSRKLRVIKITICHSVGFAKLSCCSVSAWGRRRRSGEAAVRQRRRRRRRRSIEARGGASAAGDARRASRTRPTIERHVPLAADRSARPIHTFLFSHRT